MSYGNFCRPPSGASDLRSVSLALLACLVMSPAIAAAAPAAAPAPQAEVVISEKARAHFEAGIQLLQDPDGARYEEAYEEFQAAYAASPSWKILGNIALCAMKLERDGEAIAALEKSLAEGGAQLEPEERTQQEADLKLLKDRASTLTIRSAPGAVLVDERVTVSGTTVRNRYRVPPSGELVLLVRPGAHRIVAEFADGPTFIEANLTSGAQSDMKLEPKSEAQKPPPKEPATEAPAEPQPAPRAPNIPAYVSLGIGAAGAIAGGVFLGLHLSSSGQANQTFANCEVSMDCTSADVSRIDQLDSDAALQGTVSLISFGVGAVGIGTGIALLLVPSNKEAPPTAGFHVKPYASAHTIGIQGRF